MARILEAEGWGPLCRDHQTADDAPSKPHPAMALQAIAAIGAEPGDTVVIGDTTFDIEMARAAGLRAIGVNWGHHGPELLRAAGAARIIYSFDEIWTHEGGGRSTGARHWTRPRRGSTSSP